MKFFIILFTICSISNYAIAQFETIDDETNVRTWEADASWVSNSRPGGTLPSVNANDNNINIRGYVTRTGNLTLLNDGNDTNNIFTVTDTLVVYGNVVFENNSLDLVVNGVFVIFGTITFNNQVDVGNAGNLLATGNITFTGGQGDYDLSSTGGLFSATGSVSGNGAPSAGSGLIGDFDDLETGTPEDQQLFNFVEDGGLNGPLPVELLFFTGRSESRGVVLDWATATEENFEYFEIALRWTARPLRLLELSPAMAIPLRGTTTVFKILLPTQDSTTIG